MWRSEPQIPLASTRTSASSTAPISGSGLSTIRTSPGAWNVTARTGEPYRSGGLADRDAGDLEATDVDSRAGGLRDPRFQRQLLLEVGLLAVAEGDVLALEQLDEDLDETGVELFA